MVPLVEIVFLFLLLFPNQNRNRNRNWITEIEIEIEIKLEIEIEIEIKPFILPIHQVFVFIKFRNMCQRQQNSEKFRLHKRLFYDKGPAKNLPRHFRYFWHCSNFKMNSDKVFMKKTTIF